MGLVPTKKAERIAFYASKQSAWSSNAAALNLDPAAVSAMDTKTTAAQDALAAHLAAQDAARSATINYHAAVQQMSDAGAALISQIRTTAKTGGSTIWALANLPDPATPGPVPAPGAPYEMAVILGGDGALELAWKCNNPPSATGTMYTVYRQLDGSSTWESLGVTGERKWLDATLPGGVTKVTYKIRAVRSTSGGPWTQFVVQFGTNTGGAMTASIMGTTAPKLAA